MTVYVNHSQCAACGSCVGICPTGALSLDETRLQIESSCNACGACVTACPMGAMYLDELPAPIAPLRLRSAYDVIVVGAGPAGSMAATTAAVAGASVLLLEKRQEVGSPVRCAEGVAREELLQFLEPDPLWISATIQSAEITVLTDGEPIQMAGEGGVGYILERRVFDRVLAERAVDAGADLRVKSPVVGLLMDDRRVIGVRARLDEGERGIRARVVIGADGVESWVGRWTGLTGPLPAKDHMTCAQYLLAGIDIDPTCLQYWISERHAPGGYVWLFPKGDGRANVGLGIQADLVHEAPLGALNRFIEAQPELARGSPVNLVAGGVPVAQMPKRLVGDGVMLVGDAARQVDPLTGGGIIAAMTAGRLAGQTAADAISRASCRGITGCVRDFHQTNGPHADSCEFSR